MPGCVENAWENGGEGTRTSRRFALNESKIMQPTLRCDYLGILLECMGVGRSGVLNFCPCRTARAGRRLQDAISVWTEQRQLRSWTAASEERDGTHFAAGRYRAHRI